MELALARGWSRVEAALALLAVVARVAQLGPLDRRARLSALAVLRPVESLVRRLLLIMAQSVSIPANIASRPMTDDARQRLNRSATKTDPARSPPRFKLVDPLPSLAGLKPALPPIASMAPRISSLYDERPSWLFIQPPLPQPTLQPPPAPQPILDRINALGEVLTHKERSVRRMARWLARRKQRRAQGLPTRVDPLRPGWPPGAGKHETHRTALQDVLVDVHTIWLGACVRAP